MRFGDYDFEHVCDIVPLRGTDGSLTQFMPQGRYRNARNLPLNKYGTGPFCKFTIPRRFQVSGVYVLTVEEELRYVGECANLAARFNTGYVQFDLRAHVAYAHQPDRICPIFPDAAWQYPQVRDNPVYRERFRE